MRSILQDVRVDIILMHFLMLKLMELEIEQIIHMLHINNNADIIMVPIRLIVINRLLGKLI